jgi:glycosyltransferase involved in cell wall biosynthesis
MTASSPLISVTLPNYNYGKFLAEAFQSVLSQTYSNFEILFVDDGSTDGSREIAEHFASQDSRIKPVYFEKNRGALQAHANTWERASGDLVYQYSSDDAVANPEFFQYAVAALNSWPHAGGAYGVAKMISTETGEERGMMGLTKPEGYWDRQTFVRGFLGGVAFVPGISSIWRKSAIDEMGGYDYKLGPQTDYFVNHAIPARYGVVYINRHFANARVSDQKKSYSSGTTIKDEMHRLAYFEKKYRQIIGPLGSFEAEWKIWRTMRASELLAKYGREQVLAAASADPKNKP